MPISVAAEVVAAGSLGVDVFAEGDDGGTSVGGSAVSVTSLNAVALGTGKALVLAADSLSAPRIVEKIKINVEIIAPRKSNRRTQ